MRMHGEQQLPVRVWFENADDFLQYIGKAEDFRRLEADVAALIQEAPMAAAWAKENVRQLIGGMQPGDGQALGMAITALHQKPQPNRFAREIALPGISGKFIESNLGLIASALRECGSPGWHESPSLYGQLGLRVAPRMLRVMWLDGRGEDFGISVNRFAEPDGLTNLLVVENLRTFLTLPPVPRTLAIFGEGRALQTLATINWLAGVRLFYWGDLDPYGFSILASLRAEFSGVQSIMMNAATLAQYRRLTAPMAIPHFKSATGAVVPDQSWAHLSPDELAAAKTLLDEAKIVNGEVRAPGIEQEKIPADEAAQEILRLLTTGDTP